MPAISCIFFLFYIFRQDPNLFQVLRRILQCRLTAKLQKHLWTTKISSELPPAWWWVDNDGPLQKFLELSKWSKITFWHLKSLLVSHSWKWKGLAIYPCGYVVWQVEETGALFFLCCQMMLSRHHIRTCWYILSSYFLDFFFFWFWCVLLTSKPESVPSGTSGSGTS